jgi:hypothetical protein
MHGSVYITQGQRKYLAKQKGDLAIVDARRDGRIKVATPDDENSDSGVWIDAAGNPIADLPPVDTELKLTITVAGTPEGKATGQVFEALEQIGPHIHYHVRSQREVPAEAPAQPSEIADLPLEV